jgi:hypothetical protein
MLSRFVVPTSWGVVIGLLGLLSATGAEARDPEIKGGILGTLVKIDNTKGTMTIVDSDHRERTYTITEKTVIVGPRGALVKRRLMDHRFRAGLPVTVVANGDTTDQLFLGYDHRSSEVSSARASSPSNSGSSSPGAPLSPGRTSRFRGLRESGRSAETTAGRSEADEDEDNQFPGTIKSVDPARRMVVITLLNGKDHSFLLPSDVKLTVDSRPSRQGLHDSALKPGISLAVITEAGGRKVKEISVVAAKPPKGPIDPGKDAGVEEKPTTGTADTKDLK